MRRGISDQEGFQIRRDQDESCVRRSLEAGFENFKRLGSRFC